MFFSNKLAMPIDPLTVGRYEFIGEAWSDWLSGARQTDRQKGMMGGRMSVTDNYV